MQVDRVDEKVKAFILREFKRQVGLISWRQERENHVIECPDAFVADAEGSDGVYGCDTGCEYARLEAVIRCPHDGYFDYTYGEFGDLAAILEAIDAGP